MYKGKNKIWEVSNANIEKKIRKHSSYSSKKLEKIKAQQKSSVSRYYALSQYFEQLTGVE